MRRRTSAVASAHALRRFLKTPKGQLTVALALLVAIAAPHEGLRLIAPRMLIAVSAAALVDAAVLRLRWRRWQFPSGAILTALFVVMVLSAQLPWYTDAVVSVVAIASKYARTRAANIFNPAAAAIVVTFPFLHTAQSWWGALPEVAVPAQLVLAASGIYIAARVNRLPLVVAFLGAYYALFTVAAFAADPAWVSEVFRTPDLQAVLFFAFFILTDPPTSPVTHRDQLVFAAIVALASFAIFESAGAVYYLLAGVLCGNAWEAWRRATLHQRRARLQS
jgi:Na+-translocating ferredoxin:NAD+ oxidoreductase RnfD subunit